MVADSVRFPHRIRLYRRDDETSFSDGEETLLYEGKCLIYGSSQMRTFKTDGVIKCDYAADVPEILYGVGEGGVLADIEDFNGRKTGLQVTSCYAGWYGKRKGSTIYLNISQN